MCRLIRGDAYPMKRADPCSQKVSSLLKKQGKSMAQVTETHAVFEGELVTHKQNY